MTKTKHVQLAGLNIVETDEQHLSDAVLQNTQRGDYTAGSAFRIGYLNAHVFNSCWTHATIYSLLKEAEYMYADGASVSWAARILGQQELQRATAADWLDKVLITCASQGRSIFLLGGEEGVAQDFAALVRANVSEKTAAEETINIGWHSGYFAGQESKLLQSINDFKPDLLIVGMGTPHQEQFVLQHYSQLQAGCIWWIGAGMDYFTGRQQRGPQWAIKLGHEWLGRLLRDPWRLARRYLVGNPLFLWRVFRQKLPPAARSTP